MKKCYQILYPFFLVLCIACGDQAPSAQDVIAKSIKAHGSNLVANARMEFNFRGIDYKVDRNKGFFNYERRFSQNEAAVVDQWNNTGFTRSINDSILLLPDSLANRYRSSLNSVIYFAQLPYSLDGNAVHLKSLGSTSIKDGDYYKIQVTFDENGGGEDHEDVFVYWINKQDYLVDYLAYSYCEDDCGYRFRESVNRREIKGVIVQDYLNYRPTSQDIEVVDLDEAYESGSLVLMSEINTDFPIIELND